MTPVPYVLDAQGNGATLSATLTYGGTIVASIEEIKEKDLEKWARTEASYHKATISPSETYDKVVTIRKTLVL